jgi:hypothetical protein
MLAQQRFAFRPERMNQAAFYAARTAIPIAIGEEPWRERPPVLPAGCPFEPALGSFTPRFPVSLLA